MGKNLIYEVGKKKVVSKQFTNIIIYYADNKRFANIIITYYADNLVNILETLIFFNPLEE